jgi:HAD superfamily hydrolase (TIGR01549 family)
MGSSNFAASTLGEEGSVLWLCLIAVHELKRVPADIKRNRPNEIGSMKEVFGKTKIRSREFPVILFDAGGTLFHPNPSFEKVYEESLTALGVKVNDQELDRAILKVVRKFNEVSESDENFELKPKLWTESLLQALGVDSKDILKSLQSAISSQIKMVIAHSTVDTLLALKDRGYRLGIVSNWSGVLSDVLRDQDLLPFFESVITPLDAGVAKPHQKMFEAALEDLDVEASKVICVGESYAADIVGARRLGIQSILYDPRFRELRALCPEDTSGKVVALEALRHNRRLSGIRVIIRFEELLDIFI